MTAGTDLPDPFKDLHRSHPYTIPCVVSLNSTHFMALGYNTIHWLNENIHNVKAAIVSWPGQSWTKLPEFPVNQLIWSCQATVLKNKLLLTNVYAACMVTNDVYCKLL